MYEEIDILVMFNDIDVLTNYICFIVSKMEDREKEAGNPLPKSDEVTYY